MKISVILTTYERPRFLALALEGYARQTDPAFEIVVADDGSGEETVGVVVAAARRGLCLLHVWHADRGFRKTEIVNRAIVACDGDYLVFTDGDCIPRPDFVATHRRLAAPGRFLSGGYVRLGEGLTASLSAEDVRDEPVWDAGWLRARGWRPGRRAWRLLRPGGLPAVLDGVTPTRASWNGMNASTWKEAIVEVNGFDLDLRYGGLDRELGQRLENHGMRGRQVRHRAVVLHLHHDRPYRDRAVQARQRRYLKEVRRSGRERTARGIEELADGEPARIVRHDHAGPGRAP